MTATQRNPIWTPRLIVAAASSGSYVPLVWLLLGDRAGDNAQVIALGKALKHAFGWPCVVKHVLCAHRKWPFEREPVPRPAQGEGPLVGPWPDLVIAICGRGARAGHWIKRQSGGRTRHVQLAKIDGPYDRFDLIVSTPQYELPPADHVMHLTLPIVRPDQEAIAAAALRWAPQWHGLPRPWIGVLVGGPSWPMDFPRAEAKRLLGQATSVARQCGGSLLIASGPRTPGDVAEELLACDFRHARFYPFRRGAENPYPALLALCDRFVVTSDSVSMLTDASWTGRRIDVFDLPVLKVGPGGPMRRWRRRRRRRAGANLPPDLLDRVHDTLIRQGWWRAGRDVAALVDKLKAARWVQMPGDPDATVISPREQLAQELATVVERIRALMAVNPGARSART
jgi:mitochondrial fission protein ELM1